MSFSEGTVQVSNLLGTLESVIISPLGETGPSNEASFVLPSTGAINLTLPNVGAGLNPSGWRIYRGTSAGSEFLLAQIPGNQTTFIDDGSYTPSTTSVPATSVGNLYALSQSPIGNLTVTNAGSSFISQSFAVTDGTVSLAYDSVLAQPFFANYSLIQEIDLPLDLVGAPTGNVTVSIYDNVYNNPTPDTNVNIPKTSSAAVPLATLTLPIASVSHYQTNGLYTKFTFVSPASLVVGNLYHIVISLSSSANTLVSGNYLACASDLGIGVTPTLNVGWASDNTVFSTGNWHTINSTTRSALNYKIYATGGLAANTYFYKVTATTGWSTVFTQKIFTTTTKYQTDKIYYSSGKNANESIFFSQGLNDNANYTLNAILIEYYDNQTHVLRHFENSLANVITPNGTVIAGTSKVLNTRGAIKVNFYGTTQTPTTNVTYRTHVFADHVILDLQGDSAVSGFVEFLSYVGKISSISPTDNCYTISDNYSGGNVGYGAYWPVLRDFANSFNTFSASLLPVQGVELSNTVSDVFPFLNKFTNNYDGILMAFMDPLAGYRGTAPDMILFPSAITTAINNHDTFVYNGATYKMYTVTNKYAFSQWSSNYQGSLYYPAIRIA